MTDNRDLETRLREARRHGPGLLTLLAAAFIFAKSARVTAVADWRWRRVLWPVWAQLGTSFLAAGMVATDPKIKAWAEANK